MNICSGTNHPLQFDILKDSIQRRLKGGYFRILQNSVLFEDSVSTIYIFTVISL